MSVPIKVFLTLGFPALVALWWAILRGYMRKKMRVCAEGVYGGHRTYRYNFRSECSPLREEFHRAEFTVVDFKDRDPCLIRGAYRIPAEKGQKIRIWHNFFGRYEIEILPESEIPA